MRSPSKQHWGNLTSLVGSFVQAGMHFLWPGRCLGCSVSVLPADEGLCRSCWQDLAKAVASDYCRRCGRDVSPFGIVAGRCGHCQDLTPEHDGIIRVGCYESTLRSLILALKFSERTQLASCLSQMLDPVLASSGFPDRVDWVVPVPLHWRRRLKRGFNQAHLISQKLTLGGTPICTDLVRIRNTQQQWDLTAP